MLQNVKPTAAILATAGLLSGCLQDAEEIILVDATTAEVGASNVLEDVTIHDSLGNELGPISRSIVAENADLDQELNLLARVEVQGNELLEFYEPYPGAVLVSGAGAPKGRMRFSSMEGRSVEELWSSASQGAPLPEPLAAALNRVGVRPASVQSEQEDLSDGSNGLEAGQETSLTGGWCDTNYFSDGYGNCPVGWYLRTCLNDRAGHVWWSHGDVGELYTNVCAARGNVKLQVTGEVSSPRGTWNVSQNTVRWVWWIHSSCDLWPWNDCPYLRADVLEGAGDRFHFRFLTQNWGPF